MVTLPSKQQKQHSQQVLFIEEVTKKPIVEETKEIEVSIPEPETSKEETLPISPIEEKEIPTPSFPEEKIEQKEIICENCKKTYTFTSNDYHPGIICPHCGHGQNNPNMEGRMYF